MVDTYAIQSYWWSVFVEKLARFSCPRTCLTNNSRTIYKKNLNLTHLLRHLKGYSSQLLWFVVDNSEWTISYCYFQKAVSFPFKSNSSFFVFVDYFSLQIFRSVHSNCHSVFKTSWLFRLCGDLMEPKWRFYGEDIEGSAFQ